MKNLEKIQRWVAWKLPHSDVRWAFIKVVATATSGRWSKTLVPGVTWETALKRWELKDDPCCPCDKSAPDATCLESCDNCDDWCCPQEPSSLVNEQEYADLAADDAHQWQAENGSDDEEEAYLTRQEQITEQALGVDDA